MADNEAQNTNANTDTNQNGNTPPPKGPDPKILAAIGYLTLAGWLVAYVINSNNKEKSDFALFHIRQSLGVGLLWIASYSLYWILPPIAWIVNVIVIILMVLGIIFSVQEQKKELPLIGKYFQDWFRSIS
jgi:uncharacterized membrane protein